MVVFGYVLCGLFFSASVHLLAFGSQPIHDLITSTQKGLQFNEHDLYWVNLNTRKFLRVFVLKSWKFNCLVISNTKKYPLRGYILGVLMHTTAWDQLWGRDVLLRLYIRSSASPRMAAVWPGFWHSDHVALKLRSSALPHMTAVWQAFETLTMWF